MKSPQDVMALKSSTRGGCGEINYFAALFDFRIVAFGTSEKIQEQLLGSCWPPISAHSKPDGSARATKVIAQRREQTLFGL